jgi:hypothetical protein
MIHPPSGTHHLIQKVQFVHKQIMVGIVGGANRSHLSCANVKGDIVCQFAVFLFWCNQCAKLDLSRTRD